MSALNIEYWYDDHTVLIGDVSMKKDHLTDEQGSKLVSALEVEDFHIVAYIGGMDYDVTKAFEGTRLEHFKESLLIHAWDKYQEDLTTGAYDEGA